MRPCYVRNSEGTVMNLLDILAFILGMLNVLGYMNGCEYTNAVGTIMKFLNTLAFILDV